MSAYFIISVQIGNQNARSEYDQYIEKVKPLVESFGGKYVLRSENIVPASPNWKPDRIIIIEFESIDKLNSCFSSDEYGKIKNLRIHSVEANAIIVES